MLLLLLLLLLHFLPPLPIIFSSSFLFCYTLYENFLGFSLMGPFTSIVSNVDIFFYTFYNFGPQIFINQYLVLTKTCIAQLHMQCTWSCPIKRKWEREVKRKRRSDSKKTCTHIQKIFLRLVSWLWNSTILGMLVHETWW